MGEIQKIDLKGMRVLTTKQLAEAYEVTEEKIRWNFKYNRERYIPGKHFIIIEGEELREMKRECEFHTLLCKQAKSVCFWTEKGALMHAKSLNTEKAWQAYEYLVDAYFKDKQEDTPKALPEKATPAIETKKNTIPEMRNPIWIFNVLYQFAKANKMNVRSLDLRSCFSVLNRNQIAIKTQMRLETVNYELAYELAHAMIHYNAGDIISSPLRKEYDQQAERAADMLIKLLDNVEQSI